MGIVTHPAAFPPMPAVARILSCYDRAQLAGFIEVAVGLLDVFDGDTDLEPNGDEQDVAWLETHGAGARGWVDGIEDDEDDDPGGDSLDLGEADETGNGMCLTYGLDQSRPVRADNPATEL